MAEDVDWEVGLGVEPDITSATRAGQQIGQAAYEAAKKSFLEPFSNLINSIPLSGKYVGKEGGVYWSKPADKKQVESIISEIRTAPAGSAASVSAIKNTTSILKEFRRKAESTGSYSPEQLNLFDALIEKSKTASRIGARVGRQQENTIFQMDRKAEKLSGEYASLTSAYSTAQSALDAAQEGGSTQDVNAARKEVIARARAILKPRYDSVRSAEDTKKYLKAEADNTKALQDSALASRVLAASISTLAVSAMHIGGGMVMSYARQHAQRNVFGSMEQYYEREKTIGHALGSIGGGAAGYLAGFALSSVLGPMAPLVIGSLGSSVGGQLGSLIGAYNQEELKGHQKTIRDMQTRIRAKNIYRGAYSPSFASMVGEMGTASAGDVEKMVGNSQTLAARMMFGQVSENEMFMYSLMPNYFAAAMAGASDAELAAAYANDLNALPPIMRLHVGSSVGGGSAGMVGFAQDRFFENVMRNAGEARAMDTSMVKHSIGWQYGSVERGRQNAQLAYSAAMKDTEKVRNEIGLYRDVNNRPSDVFQGYAGLFATAENSLNQRNQKSQELANDLISAFLKKDQVINIYIDGQKQEEIKIRGEEAAKAGQMSVYYGG